MIRMIFVGLRIVELLIYNALNGQNLPLKAARAGVVTTYTNLTQPTGLGGGLGWQHYTSQPFHAQVGFHRGVLRLEPDHKRNAP
jgi:hypothetical protein